MKLGASRPCSGTNASSEVVQRQLDELQIALAKKK